jgi:membrane-associated phospholipid phosphatase
LCFLKHKSKKLSDSRRLSRLILLVIFDAAINQMLHQLAQFDRHLFYIINHDWTNPFFDAVMPWISTPKNWIPLYVLIIGFCLWKYKKQGIVIILLIAASPSVADFTSVQFIKPFVHRLRPCRDSISSKTDIERVSCGPGYSFPSAHAVNHFAVAIFMILIFGKKWRWIWFWGILWAGLISFSRIYVGVHYPIDVFCGALYGSFVGWLMSLLFYWLQGKYPDWVAVV